MPEMMTEIQAWKHANFIYACYIIVGFCVLVLTLWIIKDERKQNSLLAELEQQADNE